MAPSERYERAQQMSVMISSLSFSTRTLIRVGIALLTRLYSGYGLPLHRFERAHDAFLIKEVPAGAWSRTYAILSRAPLWSTLSLVIELSPAIFPIPQITCSTTSACGESSSWIKCVRISFSIRLFTWSVVPDAIFVKHHADSN